jgi:uncharacterized membrane protein
VALVALSAIPVLAGAARLVELAGGPAVIPADAQFTISPAAVVVHIVCAVGYALVGSLQFAAGFRRRRPGWHRASGRVLVIAGSGAAGSALWLTLFSPGKNNTGDLLYVLRLLFASAMLACVVAGVSAIRRRDIASHRARMIRAYAIGLAAGTQAFTEGLGGAPFGTNVLALDAARGLGWVINLAVAEGVIRRSRVRGSRPRLGAGRESSAEALVGARP